MDRLTHEQLQELLGAYALDAVDADEAEAVELHLRDCPRCRDEVENHREAAALLAHVGAPAPAGVWDRITEQLEAEAPPFETTVGPAAEAAEAAARESGADAGRSVPQFSRAPHSAGDMGEARRRRRRSGSDGRGRGGITGLPTRVATAALATAAVLVAVLGVQVVRLDNRLDNVNAAVQNRGVEQAALSALANPDARRVSLRSDDGSQAVSAVLLSDGQAFLVADRLSALGADKTYQLWAVVGSEKISMGVLGPNPSVAAFRYSAQPSALAITAERAGGVVATQQTPVVVGAVPPVPA